MGTLMHERGTFGAGLQVGYRRNFNRLVELAHRIERNGSPRQRIRWCGRSWRRRIPRLK